MPSGRRPASLLVVLIALTSPGVVVGQSDGARSDGTDPALVEAQRLSAQSVQLRDAGKSDEALPLAERAVALYEKALGPDHPDVAQSLNNLASIYSDKGQYAKAELLHLRALAIREKALGPNHPDVATTLNSLALLYRKQGAYAKAESLYTRAIAIVGEVKTGEGV